MDKRKRTGPNQNFTKDRIGNSQGKMRGSDSPNWREDNMKGSVGYSPGNQPVGMFSQSPNMNGPPSSGGNHTHLPHYSHHASNMSSGPSYHHHPPGPYHGNNYQQRVDHDHMEMVRFLNDRWLDVKHVKDNQ